MKRQDRLNRPRVRTLKPALPTDPETEALLKEAADDDDRSYLAMGAAEGIKELLGLVDYRLERCAKSVQQFTENKDALIVASDKEDTADTLRKALTTARAVNRKSKEILDKLTEEVGQFKP